ncbi:peptidase [Bacteroides sp. 224]|nr:peptidase [Bacteroides sp. 224]
MVGLCLVYGISGSLLNHMNGKDPAFKTTEASLQLDKELTNEELTVLWADKKLPELKRVLAIDDVHSRLMLNGGIGVYNSATGLVDYELHSKNEFIYWINKLHYNKVKGWSFMADLFAFSLIFFAVSGLFIVKGKHGIARRGKWYLLAGLVIPVVYIFLA